MNLTNNNETLHPILQSHEHFLSIPDILLSNFWWNFACIMYIYASGKEFDFFLEENITYPDFFGQFE